MAVNDSLSEADVVLRRLSADHADSRFAARQVDASTQRFTIEGDDLPFANRMQFGDPTQQALLEFGRLDHGENRIEAIVRRNASPQIQKPLQPSPLHASEFCDRHEISALQMTSQMPMTTK